MGTTTDTSGLSRLRSAVAVRVGAAIVTIGALGAVVSATLASDRLRGGTEDRLAAEAAAFGDTVTEALTDAGWPVSVLPDGARQRIEGAAVLLGSEGATYAVVAPGQQLVAGDPAAAAPELGAQALSVGSAFLRSVEEAGATFVAVPLARDAGSGFVSYVRYPEATVRGPASDLRRTLLGAGLLATALLLATVLPLLAAHDRRLRERTSTVQSLLERERADAQRLAEVDRLKAAFLTAVSHELRTPLTIIKGVGALFSAQAEKLQPDQIVMLTGRMEAKIERLEQLLGDLLDIDRLARGVLEPRRTPTRIDTLAARVAEDLQTDSHQVSVSPGEVTGNVDPGHTERIVENLVRNAVKHTPEGTSIRILLRHGSGETRINVVDDGPGIPPEIRDEVFEPFVGGDPDGANPGLGGGLTLVKRLAEIHGGGAWLDDAVDRGTSVWVRLPDA